MTEQEFEVISKLSNDDFNALDSDTQIAYLQMLKEKNKKSSSSTMIPVETYVELGANLGIEVADSVTGATDMVKDIVSKKTTESLSGTQTAIVYLKMAQSVYSIATGQFKWDLLNTVSLLSSTLACLTAIGINIACMTALTSILASNPFSFALAIIVSVINYYAIGSQLAKLKKQYMTCYNSYRRIKKLGKWCDTNEIIYTGIKRVIDGCKQKCNDMIYYLTEHEKDLNNMMTRKIFVGADFNSFVLFTNIITFIQSAQDLSTTRDGVYNDYIDFCSIEDYIDTHNIITQDKCRIEYYILQGDTYGLKNFTIALDYLKGFFATYKQNKNLTKQTKSDIEYVLKCVDELSSCIGTENLINLQKENEKFLDSRNPEELFNSIYSYLIYSSAMENSPFKVCSSLLNKQYYKDQNIYEYVSAFSEYPVFLFSKWFFYFGNIMYNDIYIENYKSEIINAYNKDKSLYDFSFMKDLTDNINTFNDYKIVLLWLFSVREFLQNIVDKTYEKYSPTYATSITQTATDKDGKTLYNFYVPNNNYMFNNLIKLIDNFKQYMVEYGYDKDKYSNIFKNLFTFNTSNNLIRCRFVTQDNWFFWGKSNDKPKDVNNSFKNIIKSSGTYINRNSTQTFENTYVPFSRTTSKVIIAKGNYDYAVNIFPIVTKKEIENDNLIDITRKVDLTLNDVYYYSKLDYREFFVDILRRTKNIFILHSYIKQIFLDRYTQNWTTCYYSILYALMYDKNLRDLFFDGYNFQLSTDKSVVYNSYKEYAQDKRFDVIFWWVDNGIKTFNIYTIVDDMLKNSKNKEKLKEILDDIKLKYDEYINSVKIDISYITSLINEQIANFETILDKYVKYDSSLSYSYTDKNNTYLWNLYKSARDLGVNNKSYITNIEKHLVPVYKLKDDFIELETYYPPMFILMSAQDDSNISQAFYLYNKTAINSLFDIGNEKFSEKVNEFKDLVNLSIQPIVVDINHDKVIEKIKSDIKKSYDLSLEELTDLIGSQEDEYIIMENLTNTEILKANNEKVNSSNEELANSTQKSINSIRTLLDNKKLIKYTIIGGIGVILSKLIGRK